MGAHAATSHIASDNKTLQVALSGNLDLQLLGKVKGEKTWTVIKTSKPTTGFFDNAGERGKGIYGYRVAYNVDLGDGTYGCQVTKKAISSTVILLR